MEGDVETNEQTNVVFFDQKVLIDNLVVVYANRNLVPFGMVN